MRIGIGYDVHVLAQGRSLVLGGVKIPFERGLLGHSDADVLVHAACDALLGGAGLGDIGQHFPDNAKKYKDIYSIKLLEKTYAMVKNQGYCLGNMDATVFAQAPQLAPYCQAMQKTIAKAMQTSAGQINIKATTTEGLGSIGAGEAMAAMCVTLLLDS